MGTEIYFFLLAGHYGEIFESQPNDEPHQYVIDAGTLMNSAYPLVLRPQREIDIILSFDFSSRKSENKELLDVSLTFDVSVVVIIVLFELHYFDLIFLKTIFVGPQK